jgi:hypothetical protein
MSNFNSNFSTSNTSAQSQNQNSYLSKKARQQKTAQSYNSRRAEYKRAVSELRKQYASTIERQTKLDEESKQKQLALVTRKRLERQRLKNIKSVQHAMLQEQRRVQRKQEFEQHLKHQKEKDQQKQARFHEARKLLVNELEQQATHWMTSKDEVDAVLSTTRNPFIDQHLWTRPGSFVGEPAPSTDASFWRYEAHTWKIQSNYPTAKEKLLEDLKQRVYEHTNVDYKKYWTHDEIQHQRELEQKAKLRALVLNEGKKVLLNKQRQLLKDLHHQQQINNTQQLVIPPKLQLPVPSTDILANTEAMEQAGVNALRENPGKFFVFSDAHRNDDNENETNELGTPIRLVDPIRDSVPTGTPYPELIARLPKPDTRTEREKKKQEREEKMLAAASGDEDKALEADIEDEISFGSNDVDVDYDESANFGDEFDREWEEGLDAVHDKHIIDTPFAERYTEEDIDWIISQLQKKVQNLQEILALEEEGKTNAVVNDDYGNFQKKSRETLNSAVDGNHNNDEGKDKLLDAMGPDTIKTIRVDEKGREYASYEAVGDGDYNGIAETSGEDIDDLEDLMSVLTSDDLNDIIRFEDKNNVLRMLNEEQMKALQSIDDDDDDDDDKCPKTAKEIRKKLAIVPGLSDAQIQSLVDLEMSLAQSVHVQQRLKGRTSK